MAVTLKNLVRIMELPEPLLPGGAVLELGAQQVNCQGNEAFIQQFIEHFAGRSAHSRKEIARFANGGYFGELLTACDFDYRSVDLINGGAGSLSLSSITLTTTASPSSAAFISRRSTSCCWAMARRPR